MGKETAMVEVMEVMMVGMMMITLVILMTLMKEMMVDCLDGDLSFKRLAFLACRVTTVFKGNLEKIVNLAVFYSFLIGNSWMLCCKSGIKPW